MLSVSAELDLRVAPKQIWDVVWDWKTGGVW